MVLLKSYVVYPLLFYGIILVVLRFAFLELLALSVKIAIIPVDIINVSWIYVPLRCSPVSVYA